jgi:hypothetical protein
MLMVTSSYLPSDDLDTTSFVSATIIFINMSGIQFTTLIRVPFSRGDFVEPPQVSDNAS